MSSSNKNRSPVVLHEHKIPSKFLTRDPSSLSNPNNSFRVYYGKCAAGSVPFNWESQPGTPKHPSSMNTNKLDQHMFPPLTPPPSYFHYPSSESVKKKVTKSGSLLHVIFPKLTLILRRPNVKHRSNYSPSISSCSSSEPSSPALGCKRHEFSSSKEEGVHALMPCFGPWR